ncbi:curli-like amyloid fiber formation chaperone CsgH [Methylobacterium sp. 17Sr1-1]|uniref:curli-like amyloid fiber formation chaperone CsgH n=1 Tax=Methylobacterium sp. 17Sr1-1 TaxID=2202826 RepID=UPI000D6F035E|nr:curli-like amyloid fiber formation chaperone CsgH [Methylobacterium sp. 17Sr1-1]AWN50453.1 hypothetical protein DK412_00840 [Methylobacterium sp. 17Sr1-1]
MPTIDLPAAGPATCIVVESRSLDGARIAVRITASEALSGRYSLQVRKSDAAGSAVMEQAGGFATGAGETRGFGQVLVSVAPAGELVLDARIAFNGTTVRCGHQRTDSL